MGKILNAINFIDCHNILGEGIIWDKCNQTLYWLDMIEPSKLFKWQPSYKNKYDIFVMPEMITAISLTKKNGLIIASKKGINFYDFIKKDLIPLVQIENHLPNNRLNDGGSDRNGRFWFGTMENNISDKGIETNISSNTGSIYRLDADMSYHCMEQNLYCTNTFVWNPDNTIMYFTDSISGKIFSYNYNHEKGIINNKKIFAKTTDGSFPDGSTIDSEGYLWTCCYGSGNVCRFSPEGKIDCIVKVPVKGVTNCTFGGLKLETLFITTSSWGMKRNDILKYPHAGNLFSVETGIKGLPDERFNG